MCELEILKNYPSKIRNPPQARNLVVFAHHPKRMNGMNRRGRERDSLTLRSPDRRRTEGIG
jgi:hypothetical protein